MKKVIFSIICLFLLAGIVSAKDDNKLYFTDKGDRLYYDTTLYDEDLFISNLDMVPGKEYRDELLIKNQSSVKYRLYLKINDIEENPDARELLENINMIILVDDIEIYNGTAHGLTYYKGSDGYSLDVPEKPKPKPETPSEDVDLKDAMYVGDYDANKMSKMVVITKLNEDYSNTKNTNISHVEWGFVAEYGDELLPINPDTSMEHSFNVYYLLILLMVIGSILFLIIRKRKA